MQRAGVSWLLCVQDLAAVSPKLLRPDPPWCCSRVSAACLGCTGSIIAQELSEEGKAANLLYLWLPNYLIWVIQLCRSLLRMLWFVPAEQTMSDLA